MLKKYLLKAVTLLSLTFSNLLVADVTVPDWYDALNDGFANIDTLSSNWTDDVNYFNKWKSNLDGLCDDLSSRLSKNQKTLDCLLDKYNTQLSNITTLGETLDTKNTKIDSLNNDIKTLENTIATLNGNISDLNDKISNLKTSYATLLNLDSDKANTLLTKITSLKTQYDAMIQQRDIFRTSLEAFYNCSLAGHNTESTAYKNLANKLSCDPFDYSSLDDDSNLDK